MRYITYLTCVFFKARPARLLTSDTLISDKCGVGFPQLHFPIFSDPALSLIYLCHVTYHVILIMYNGTVALGGVKK